MSKHEDNASAASSAIAARNLIRTHPMPPDEMAPIILAHVPAPPVELMERIRCVFVRCTPTNPGELTEWIRLQSDINGWLKENK